MQSFNIQVMYVLLPGIIQWMIIVSTNHYLSINRQDMQEMVSCQAIVHLLRLKYV